MRIEEFHDRYIPEPNTGCWLWMRPGPNGYGRVALNGKRVYAHRISYFLKHGQFPSDNACHTCDTPSCVNPDHIYDGTQKDNINDAYRRGRRPSTRKEFCKRGHARLPENLDPSSGCKACKLITERLKKASRKKS